MAYDLSSPAVGRVPGHDKENPSPPLIQKGAYHVYLPGIGRDANDLKRLGGR